MKSNVSNTFKNSLFANNSVFVQCLGLSPALAMTATLFNAIGMGIVVTLALIGSNFVISLLRRFIPKTFRVVIYLVIIAGVVTAIELLARAYVPAMVDSFGIYLPLVSVSCLILARADKVASKYKICPSVLDGFVTGCGFTVALCVIASIREILGSGSLFGIKLFGGYAPLVAFSMPIGGLLTLGCIMALVQHLNVRNGREGGIE